MNTRKSAGQATVVMVTFIAFLFVLVAGLFSFELNRVEVARQQLQAACEAAALAGAATLAGSDETQPMLAHTNASATALNTFQKNAVAGTSLADAVPVMDDQFAPAPGDSSLYIEFLDPHNNNAPVQLGDPNGKIVRVIGALGFQPAFSKFVGVGNVPLRAVASGGVPQLDLALCFDVSASIDDQTPVTFVRRQWNASKGKTDYIIASTAAGSPAGALAQGRLYDILGPQPTGSAVDGLPPQTLSDTNSSAYKYPLYFSEESGTAGSARGLRGATNAGSPPGNATSLIGTGNSRTFTDLVVNIDGNTRFQGITSNGYAFPDLATLVEAARGNLEDATTFRNSRADKSVPNTISPRPGYLAEYIRLAKENLHPLKDAQEACKVFLSIMNTNTDAHFSLIAFTTNAGSSAGDVDNMANVDSTYSPGGTGSFPVPLIALNSATTATNYTTCLNAIGKTVPISGTNIGDAVNTACNQLKNNSRAGAKKAIVVFTDGQPTSAGPLSSDPWSNARKAADVAKKAGIPIYTIGLAQVPEIVDGETRILNDTNPDPNTGGIAAIAKNGGKFWLVTNVAHLRATFENLARNLVQLVR